MASHAAPAPVSPVIAFAVAALGIAVFAGMDAVVKGLSIQLGSYTVLFWRSLFGTLIGTVLFIATRPRWPSRTVMIIHAKRGAIGAFSMLFFFWGLVRVPLAQGTALSFIAPIVALFLASALLGERVGRGAILGSVVALFGVAIIVWGQWASELGDGALLGAGSILIAALFYGYSLILTRQQSQLAGPIEAALFINIFMLLVTVPAAPFVLTVPPAALLPLLLAASVLAFVSLLLLAWAYARAEAQYLVPVEYSAFLWAALFGWIGFGEAVSLPTIAGAALIVAGCLTASWRRPARLPEAELEGTI